MNLKQIVQDYFTFSRNERKGLTILLVIIFLLALANKIIFYFETPGRIDAELLNAGFDSKASTPGKEPKQGTLFTFNPNTIDSLALDSLALSKEIKRNLVKYREKGGHYSTAKDFKKTYGVTDSVFRTIEPYINIETAKEKPVTAWIAKTEFSSSETKAYKKKLLIEINSTDSVTLMDLPGIGTTLSKRIIKYRDLLGGFYTFEQLKEVYGIKATTLDQIQEMITVDSTKVQKVDLNFSDRYELSRHPYIGKAMAHKIVNFRTRYGKISDAYILRDSLVMDDQEYERLKPYL